MDKRNLLIAAVVIIVAGIIGGFVFVNGRSTDEIAVEPTPTPPTVLMLAQDALAVSLAKGSYSRYVLTIDKLADGVVGLSYEITYDTTNKGTQGIVGSPSNLKAGQTKYTNPEIVFGSESRGKYSLDQGVNNIQINIRLTFKDGSEKGWKGSLEI